MRSKLLPFAIVLTALLPTYAEAQTCLGVPLPDRTGAYAALGLPQNATSLHIGGIRALSDPYVVSAELRYTSFASGLGRTGAIGVTGVYQLEFDATIPLSVCPLAHLGYGFFDGPGGMDIGVGSGIGVALPLSNEDFTLYPYAVPTITNAHRTGLDDIGFMLRLGANLGFSRYYIGGQFSKIFGAGSSFRLQAGLSY
jgi:hypothetical protein